MSWRDWVGAAWMPVERSLVFSFPAKPESLAACRRLLEAFLEALNAGRTGRADVVSAVSEATSNVVEHAYPQDKAGALEVSLLARDGLLFVLVEDSGRWAGDAETGGRETGRGLHIMRALASRLTVNKRRVGTEVEMLFDLRRRLPTRRAPIAAA
jgi:serine/threonine-protein kinase RsbW